ncbi:MAG TPA: hypothetical protein PLG32_02910 [Piscinibacter sp.]|jgi:hypothetical protein|nr:hypothetical protein [Piscinibacter sp.]HPG78552.1 hypothetical protein [Piscinibacter sp.]
MHRIRSSLMVLTTAAVLWPLQAAAQTTVYRCPGNVYTSSADISAKEAEAKGCKTIEGAPITVIQGTRPRTGSPVPASGPRPADSKVEPAQQRARDGDARRILESELKKEEEQLEQMRKEFNNGEPERRGDERNYQKYLDRVAEMKAAIARKESDIAAIKREISKLPAS